jgi:hypothetical protein
VTENPLRRPAHTSKLSSCRPSPGSTRGRQRVHKRRVHGPAGWGTDRLGLQQRGDHLLKRRLEEQTLIDSTVRSEDLALGYKAHKNAWQHQAFFFEKHNKCVCASLRSQSASTRNRVQTYPVVSDPTETHQAGSRYGRNTKLSIVPTLRSQRLELDQRNNE